jgi:hypothetical protein
MAKAGLVSGVYTPVTNGTNRKSLDYKRVPEEILISKENSLYPEKINLDLCKRATLPDGTVCNEREATSSGIFFCKGKENCPL